MGDGVEGADLGARVGVGIGFGVGDQSVDGLWY
jgi:hypothetical protein